MIKKPARQWKKFTKKEDQIIQENYQDLSSREIGELLQRSEKAIVDRVYKMRFENKRKIWSPIEINFLINYYKGTKKEDFNLKDLSNYLGCDKSTTCRKAKELGLTDKKRKNSKSHKLASGKGMKNWHSKYEHPRGMLGKHHTQEVKDFISKGHLGKKYNLTDEQRKKRSERSREQIKKMMKGTNMYSRTNSSIRKDLGLYLRSNWEANYIRILNLEKIKWNYEPKTFECKDEKKGIVSYIPDIYLPDTDEWLEVKGWLDSRSKMKLKLFKKHFPEDFKKLQVVIKSRQLKTLQWFQKLGVTKIIDYDQLRAKYKHSIIWEGE